MTKRVRYKSVLKLISNKNIIQYIMSCRTIIKYLSIVSIIVNKENMMVKIKDILPFYLIKLWSTFINFATQYQLIR